MEDFNSVNFKKKAMRQELSIIRNSISLDNQIFKSAIIKNKIISIDLYKNADVLLAFCSYKSEVNTDEIIINAFNNNKTVAIPKVINNELMKFYIIDSIDDYNKLKTSDTGYKGITEPTGNEVELIINNKLKYFMLVPGLGFDNKKYRIGYGGGYYDRFISNTSSNVTKAMIAYEEQHVNNIPVDSYDKSLDLIITDKAIYQ